MVCERNVYQQTDIEENIRGAMIHMCSQRDKFECPPQNK